MAQQSPPMMFDDVPLEDARRMARGPRMDPALYHALTTKIASLTSQAVRMTILDGTSPNTIKYRILRVAAGLKVPVTVRKVPDGLIFWRSTAEDLRQAREVNTRLQTARHKQRTPSRARRRPTSR
jgi:precorrin-4 methylase